MKYAFILGSNSYIVPNNTISFSEGDEPHNFLRIVSVYRDTPPDQPRAALTIDAEFKDNEGHLVRISGNKPETPISLDIMEKPDRVLITKPDGHVVLDVHQMDHRTAMHLEHNIVAELEVHAPVIPIRLRATSCWVTCILK